MGKRIKQIKSIVETLLERSQSINPPVDVTGIAKGEKIAIREEELGEISGLLFREGNQVVIGVNRSHSRTRKRFTIAHELGHFFLHSENPLFIDKVFAVKLRDHVSSKAIDRDEIEANAFAAELLMPSKLLANDFLYARAEILDYEDHGIEDVIKMLAEKYQVSTHAMTIRLINLDVIPDIL